MELVQAGKTNLVDLIEKINNDRDSFLITNEDGQSIIAMALDDFESIMETLHLLSSKANTEHLFESIKEYKSGKLKTFSIEQLEESLN
jgi:antitoxin YefM